MSKAILILDEMPECCDDCIAYSEAFCGCRLKGKQVHFEYIPDWCPLRPVPERATLENSNMSVMKILGWNACLDTLTGEDNREFKI